MGFTRHEAPMTKMITLILTRGEWPKITTEMVNFLVMDLSSPYNDIIGRVFQEYSKLK